jgi:hypothetical protein
LNCRFSGQQVISRKIHYIAKFGGGQVLRVREIRVLDMQARHAGRFGELHVSAHLEWVPSPVVEVNDKGDLDRFYNPSGGFDDVSA